MFDRNTSLCGCSQFPLSIVLVGVGDGLWDMMQEFDDNISARSFDNFQVEDRPMSAFLASLLDYYPIVMRCLFCENYDSL